MLEQIWDRLMAAKHIVLISHVHPDGDTLGSCIGLYHALKQNGKKTTLFNAAIEDLPREFRFLSGYEKITNKLPKEFDLIVSCDCGSFDRLGIQKGVYELINVDHHKTNTYFGSLNLVDDTFASVGALIYGMLQKNGVKISKKSAEAFYASLGDDTGFFRYGKVNAKTFQIASELIECGADAQKVAKYIKADESLAKVRLRAFVLQHFCLHHNALIASVIIDQKVIAQTGAKRSDTKNMIIELRNLSSVKVAIMILEQLHNYKVSLRSDGDIDVSKIAQSYGGGGHYASAGFEIKTSEPQKLLENIIKKVTCK
ncbi:MAG: bifunctional oligoribonuclease/PAP phosphatase NrnA [Sulfurospirillum sp.]|nr:bifunctional oligoribonuclease/PAP phosphatase NrnA [Sulfurospirillum sp.]